VVFGPHETNLGRRRTFSERHTAYYARRAAGGAGVVVTEVASVHDSDWPYERAPLAADAVPGWADVVAACRPHGALVLAGLGHAGGQGSSAHHQRALWAPSRVADVGSREVPAAMEPPEIDAVVAGFADAARLAVSADLDGVEVGAGQHSLLRQFLSGLTNHRTDAHADRSLLLRRVLAAVRAALGTDRVLGLRLCCDELAPWAGITPGAGVRTAAAVARWVDYVAPVRGSALSVGATRPDLHTGPGFNRELCSRVRAAAGVATVLQGSVVGPAMAQAALDGGGADLVEMTRAQIADPDLVAHVRAGTPGRIRPCTLTDRAVRHPRNPLVTDDAEPRSGHETLDPPVEGTDPVALDVLVVGGGPAGLEAARVLALRGHRVRLAEREPVLGGALRWAAAVHGRGRLGLLVPWWQRELDRLGVDVRTGVEVEEHDLDGPVLLATGGRDGPRPYDSDVPVLSAAALLAGAALPPDRCWCATPSGTPSASGSPRGSPPPATRPGSSPRTRSRARSSPATWPRPTPAWSGPGVVRELRSLLRGVRDGRAVLEHVWTGERRTVACAAVVDCGHRLPDDALARARPDLPRAGTAWPPARSTPPSWTPAGPLRGSCTETAARAATSAHGRRRRGRAERAAAGRAAGAAEPGRVPRPPDQLRRGRAAHRAARPPTTPPGRGRGRAGDHRGAGRRPARPAYEKTVDGTDPARRPRLPGDHRRGPRPRRRRAGPAHPQRRAGRRAATPAARARAVAGAGPAVPRGARRAGRRRHRPDRRRATPAPPRTASRAGSTASEVQGAHSSLVRSSSRPATNHRTDAHGRDRARFLLEVVEAVRGAIGPDRVLGVRLCGDEGIEHGIGIDDAVATARRLEATGGSTCCTRDRGRHVHAPPGHARRCGSRPATPRRSRPR
jgi:2,4-dienoyl-CoA reductase (NADPH2)